MVGKSEGKVTTTGHKLIITKGYREQRRGKIYKGFFFFEVGSVNLQGIEVVYGYENKFALPVGK